MPEPIIKPATKEDMILYRFDPDSPTPKLRGMAYYERSFLTSDGVEMPGTSRDGDAQPVSIAKGVRGIALEPLLGKIAAGLQELVDDQAAALAVQAATIAALRADLEACAITPAELEAKNANIQALLARLAETEAGTNAPASAAEAGTDT